MILTRVKDKINVMEKSPSIKSIAIALCSFQAECPIIPLDREVEVKTKSGGAYKFKYATISNIVETIRPLLTKHKLSYVQPLEPDGSVTTILMHDSGEFISSNLLIKGEQNPQGIGSAITYAKRYSLCAILGIVADDDDDANIAEGNQHTTKDSKPWLNKDTEQWGEAIKYLTNGGDIKKIEAKYRINKANRQLLLTEAI